MRFVFNTVVFSTLQSDTQHVYHVVQHSAVYYEPILGFDHSIQILNHFNSIDEIHGISLCSNAKTRDFDAVLGETALVRTMLCDRGLPVTEIFVEELLSLSSVDEMQAVLRDKLEPMLPPGYHGAVPALEEVQLHGHEDEDDTRGVEEVPVVGNVVEKEDLLELKRVADKEEASEHSKGTKTMHADVDTVSDTLHVQVDEQGGVLGDQLEEPSPQGGVKLGEVEGVKGADERSVVHTHEGVDGEVVAQRGAG